MGINGDFSYFIEHSAHECNKQFGVGVPVRTALYAESPWILPFITPILDSTTGRVRAMVGASVLVDSLEVDPQGHTVERGYWATETLMGSPGRATALFGGNDSIYRTARDLKSHGIHVEAIVDSRNDSKGDAAGVPVIRGALVADAVGGKAVKSVHLTDGTHIKANASIEGGKVPHLTSPAYSRLLARLL